MFLESAQILRGMQTVEEGFESGAAVAGGVVYAGSTDGHLYALDLRSGALEWKYAAGLSVREIAERLEISEKAAESLLTRARVVFREAFSVSDHDAGRRTGEPPDASGSGDPR